MLDNLIEKAHADRGEVPELCRQLLESTVIIVGSWADDEGTHLRIQDFRLQDDFFIPLFSDKMQFWGQLGSTPFAMQGLEIDCRALVNILQGHEILILNPGSTAPVQLSKFDFDPFVLACAAERTKV